MPLLHNYCCTDGILHILLAVSNMSLHHSSWLCPDRLALCCLMQPMRWDLHAIGRALRCLAPHVSSSRFPAGR